MNTAILVDQIDSGNALISSFNQRDTHWVLMDADEIYEIGSADLVVFMQQPVAIPAHFTVPVLINDTTSSFQLPANDERPVARFCGWPTMVERRVWEVAAYHNAAAGWMHDAEKMLNRKLCVVPNTPGFIAPRILATIINEACHGLAQNICSENDMDVAMQLGTNYPKGPIAWMHEIGKENIAELLGALALHEKRYSPHPMLNLQ
jgi:hypothetical protein